MVHFRRSLCAVLVAGVLVGCSPQATVTPSPSPSSSPTAGASASEQGLFAEAERVFRAQYAALLKYYGQGGSQTLPPEFKQWTTGTYRAEIQQFLQAAKQTGDRYLGPPPRIVVNRADGVVMADSVIAVAACVDSSKSNYRNPQGKSYKGSIDIHTAFFKREEGALKLFENRIETVTSCPA